MLPHCAAIALPVIDTSATKTPMVTGLNCFPLFIRTPLVQPKYEYHSRQKFLNRIGDNSLYRTVCWMLRCPR